MTLNEAITITGGLSHPSKMPCPCWSLSQKLCVTGARQAQMPGTVCSKCYAARGHYTSPIVHKALARRLEGLKHPSWVRAMTMIIEAETPDYFRWFDSGDLQSSKHFNQIMHVARNLKHIKFWLPTQEQIIVAQAKHVPRNLTIRVTAPMINPVKLPRFKNVAVVSGGPDKPGWDKLVKKNSNRLWYCPADGSGPHKCGACRACWDKKVEVVVYRRK